MTRLYINDKEIAPPLDVSSLNQILRYIESTHLPANSVVRKIQIDGLPLMPENLSNGQSKLLDQIDTRDKIEIFTGTVAEIAQDSVAEALAYLDRIETATPSLIISFQTTPGHEAYESLRQLYEGFYWLNLLLDKLKANFLIKLDDILIQEIPAHEHHRKFVSILKQLIDSQQKGDFVMIADLLEYEILPLMPVWREMFGMILKKMSMTQ
jgi:hypothetical protein